jgi:glycosyltransferase involved in cell wall biosynthesis
MARIPKVSIITVSYNAETFIDAAIRSVVSQTYDNIEHIIVDGASTDGTLAIIKRYKDRISKIISEKDAGIYDAMNKGIRHATGDVIYFLNADDRLYDEKVIEDVVREFEADTQVGLVLGQTQLENAPEGHCLPLTNSYTTAYRKKRDIILRAVNHQRIFCRKWVFEKTGLFDLRYPLFADNDWFLKAVYKIAIPVKYVPRTVAFYNYRGKSRAAGYPRLAYEKWRMILRHSLWDFAVYVWDQTWVGFSDYLHCLRRKRRLDRKNEP